MRRTIGPRRDRARQDYHVETIENGRTRAGPSHAYRPIPAGPAERTSFARQFAMGSPIGGRDGGLGHAPVRGALLARVRLRPDRRLLTVGRHAWVVRTDGAGLQTIERHALPQL